MARPLTLELYARRDASSRPFPQESVPLGEWDTLFTVFAVDIRARRTFSTALGRRADPPIRVQCATCHRGTTEPRMLQEVREAAYDQGGLDSTLARYQSLRDRY